MDLKNEEDRSGIEAASLREAFRVFGSIGLLSFGGPAAQIALMHRVLVDEKRWLSEQHYLNALSFCMLLPGPEAMQLATYTGWRLHGVLGGLMAGLLFVLPGAIVILALSSLYAFLGDVPLVNAAFLGIKAAVVVIVIEALLKVARRALKRADHYVLAGLAFVAIFFFSLPFPLIIALAAFYGAFVGRQTSEAEIVHLHQSAGATLRTILIWLLIWWGPLMGLWLFASEAILAEFGFFFSKLAVVTFGGAYAVLAYMAQDVVNQFGWLDAGEMMDGLGLAETTPGPLILVTQFVGFLAAFKSDGYGTALLASVVTLWATFVPCFLWIFAGAPYIEWIGAQPRLREALSGITAAVVGVILNLSIWFSFHVFFKDVQTILVGPMRFSWPQFNSADWLAICLALLCAVLLFRLKWNLAAILFVSALGGLLLLQY